MQKVVLFLSLFYTASCLCMDQVEGLPAPQPLSNSIFAKRLLSYSGAKQKTALAKHVEQFLPANANEEYRIKERQLKRGLEFLKSNKPINHALEKFARSGRVKEEGKRFLTPYSPLASYALALLYLMQRNYPDARSCLYRAHLMLHWDCYKNYTHGKQLTDEVITALCYCSELAKQPNKASRGAHRSRFVIKNNKG